MLYIIDFKENSVRAEQFFSKEDDKIPLKIRLCYEEIISEIAELLEKKNYKECFEEYEKYKNNNYN
jgi:hypothetical protein